MNVEDKGGQHVTQQLMLKNLNSAVVSMLNNNQESANKRGYDEKVIRKIKAKID